MPKKFGDYINDASGNVMLRQTLDEMDEAIDIDEMNDAAYDTPFDLNDIQDMKDDIIDFFSEDLDSEYQSILESLIYAITSEAVVVNAIDMLMTLEDNEAALNTDMPDEMASEAVAPRRVKINRSVRLKRHRDYRKNRAKIKMKSARYRRSASYKQYKRKSKRMNKVGKTASGKRQRKFY